MWSILLLLSGLFLPSQCGALVHTLSSSQELSLSCSTTSPWFFCVWEGPHGDRACALRTQMDVEGPSLCGEQDRLVIRGNSTQCTLVIRNPTVLDAGSWTCAINDEQMDMMKDSQELHMVEEGKMSLREGNTTEDTVEYICTVTDTFPAPHLAWSRQGMARLTTSPLIITPSSLGMPGLVTIRQSAYLSQ